VRVRREDRQALDESLSDQQPVERVVVVRRKSPCLQSVPYFDRERVEPLLLEARRNILFRSSRNVESPFGMLIAISHTLAALRQRLLPPSSIRA